MSEHLKGAWAALMRGDADERDRLCALAETEIKAKARSRAIENLLKIDFLVYADGRTVSTREVLAAVL